MSHRTVFRHSALAGALLAAFSTAQAQPVTTEGHVTVGFGLIDGRSADRALFGQYNGLPRSGSAFGILGVDYYNHDPDSGRTLRVLGKGLLGDNRELSASWKSGGDWRIGAEIREGVRREPYTLNSGLGGAGSAAPQVTPLAAGAGADIGLKLKRSSIGLSLWTALSESVTLDISLKSENKDGARLFGIGMNCPSGIAPGCRGTTGIATGWALLMLPEPIKANHSQIEAQINYAGEHLHLSAGYYGSFYSNGVDRLTPGVPASLNNPLGSLLPLSTGLQGILSQPVALPPDNQAHQLDLTGQYAFAPQTHLRFKFGYAEALQTQNFAGAGLAGAPAGVSNLGGRVVTTLALIGLSARPLPKLSLQADLRYEDKDDQTPIAAYNVEGSSTYTNRALPNRKSSAKLQAGYQFSSDMRATLAAGYEAIDRGLFTASSAVSGISALRQRTDETGYRAELRRTLSESFSGAIGFEHSQRNGSNWLRDNSGLGVTEVADPAAPGSGLGPNSIYMPTLANRERDKIKLRADWQPSATLAMQFRVEDGRDTFNTPGAQGLRSTGMGSAAVDWTYALNDLWNLNGYASQGRQRLHQSRPAGYILSFVDTTDNLGVGVSGKPRLDLELGGQLSYANDVSVYNQTLDATASADSVALLAASGGLPNTVFRQTTLKLFGKYELNPKSSLRAEIVHQRSRLSDWTWGYAGVPFAYSDGTTLWQKPNQAVTMLALTYSYRFK
jgi:MtrB/PioB family decaheme-associated outer membrane protein